MPRSLRRARPVLAAVTATLTAALLSLGAGPAAAAAGVVPDQAKAVQFLVDPASLVDGKYYLQPPFPGIPMPATVDLSLTLDSAFALATVGGQDARLHAMMEFLRSGAVVEEGAFGLEGYLGIGTDWAFSGGIAKVALLAEATGYDPRSFLGHDLIAALRERTCATTDLAAGCEGPGSYVTPYSVFSQALGIMAQIRAGERADAAGPVAFLLGLQHPDGSFPSLIPASAADRDIDSTAMAVMALSLAGDDPAAASAVDSALTWIASQQDGAGWFPGAAGHSTNTTALAIQALSLRPGVYEQDIAEALGFLAGQQNADGGFNVSDTQPGSDLRASTQVVGGMTGVSFGAVLRDVHAIGGSGGESSAPSGSAGPTGGVGLPVTGTPIGSLLWAGAAMSLAGAAVLLALRRRRLRS